MAKADLSILSFKLTVKAEKYEEHNIIDHRVALSGRLVITLMYLGYNSSNKSVTSLPLGVVYS